MKIFNLTDHTPPGQKPRTPRELKIKGKMAQPGDFVEVPDSFALGPISGWIYSQQVSIDGVPPWYKIARQEARKVRLTAEKAAVTVVPTAEETAPEPKPKSKTKKKRSKKG